LARLPEHPQHALARKHMKGFGGMLTFVIKGGPAGGARSCPQRPLRLFTVAESLGGVENLIEHPASMTHASVPPETRASWASRTDSSAVRWESRTGRTW